MKQNVDLFEKVLLSLDRLAAWEMLQETANEQPVKVLEEVVIPALERIGEGWNQGRVALSQVYISGRICEELVDKILPKEAPERKYQPRMAIAVLEDYHLLGKRIVYATLRASGYELKDYGRISVDDLVDQVRDDAVEFLLISVLMLPSALKVKQLVTRLKESEMNVKVIVGGAPFLFDRQLWKTVGADAMGKNAAEALTLTNKLARGAS